MKNISLLFMLIGLATVVRAQEVVIDTSYYKPPPPVRARTLQADPEKNYGSHPIRVVNGPTAGTTWPLNSTKYAPGT